MRGTVGVCLRFGHPSFVSGAALRSLISVSYAARACRTSSLWLHKTGTMS